MTAKEPPLKKKHSVDWFFQGVLTKLGDTFDRFTGRRWTPSSSLAASELIERLRKLLDAEARSIPGKGLVVPHNIKLRMQWDKFSDDAVVALKKLEIELLTAAVDHINDSLYYTFAPVSLQVKPDYFVEGVKLVASFEDFTDEDPDVQLNVTIPAMKLEIPIPEIPVIRESFVARFDLKGVSKEKRLDFRPGGSVSVGRTGSNDLVIDDGSVSKIHASLSINSDGRLVVSDTGSTNGTFINDTRLAYGKATVVEPGDKVRFGTVDANFEHVPRPVVIEEPEMDQEPTDKTFEIDGFEFRGGTSAQVDDIEAAESSAESEGSQITESNLDDTIRAIPVPRQTLPNKEPLGSPGPDIDAGGFSDGSSETISVD